ncbi:DUF1643 domain-containing protein [Roseitranquillus sediminis]|uniref:DUF1643 domain-containing protein n=1 Tax=Roseitranquillus sediminis TaxID=2809051 RepID=UPI001D0C1B84|nr:DUF1643 domain-containing protein [Roseitranquillus sediminis]MBM9593681.1 DUF1643 domain-containing protein [Roseitranquillus sediminis]
MIVRRHEKAGTTSAATYSPCGLYRYALTREWDAAARRILWVMLNPSTASEVRNDPTIERCERRSHRMGYGAMRVANIFAFRATRPAELARAADPVGAENHGELQAAVAWADDIVAAWGAHGRLLGRGAAAAADLRRICRPVLHLGLTSQGEPRHPLYVAYAVEPTLWL